ncbi:MAG: DUF2794 domain-containing protein [Ahrensia sp.]|nr:DUF2794 domain-containing protein [Ahrensia sp.]
MSAKRQSDDEADLINLNARRPLLSSGTTNIVISSTGNPAKPSQVSFDRHELSAILRIYGFKVAAGEWRDYTIDQLKDQAIFSVYRKAHETPLFRIEKHPRLARKQGAYCIIGNTGTVVKRGHDLATLLRFFEKQLKIVS